MRLAIAGCLHESNTFLSVPTTIERFAESSFLRGPEILEVWADSPHEWSGFIEGAAAHGAEVVPLLVAHAMPSGTLTADCFETIAGGIIDALSEAGDVDGVYLGLHGATVSERYLDADGEIASRARGVVGPDVPIVVTLDCHANVTRKLVGAADMVSIYRTCPHLDQKQRGLEAADLLVRLVKREIHPVAALETPPMFINITRQHTDQFPARLIREDAEAVRERPDIVAASFALGFPYADVPEMGMSFLAYADGSAEAARDAAIWMAQRAWAHRSDYLVDAMEPAEAVREAAGSKTRPVVLNDIGDNVGGGSAADSTFLLEEAYRQGASGMCIVLYDPAAVRECLAAGVGAKITLEVGGKTDDLHGKPVEVTGVVRALTDGRFTEPEPRHMGLKHMNQGLTAVISTPEEHSIMLTTYRQAPASLHQLLHAGIDPKQQQMIVAKGVILPQPAYTPVAARTILVNTPGSTTAANETFTYRHIRQSLYPFDPDAVYTPGKATV